MISVIGLGYIGLPTAAFLASKGHYVLGIDTNNNVVDSVNRGLTHIIEPDLEACVRNSVSSGRLLAFNSIQKADIYIICVPTPIVNDNEFPSPNIDLVLDAAQSISSILKAGDVVILESTCPIGTTQIIADLFSDAGVDVSQINIAYCPERVLPGKILLELTGNDRIVGGLNDYSTKIIASFYRTFVNGEVFETDSKTAEMCKLAENSYRDVNIAFANELSIICHRENIDVWKLIKLANHHPRVNILQPGPGVGGHCIAVDPWFIVSRDIVNTKIIQAARRVNDYKKDWVVKRVKSVVESYIKDHNRAPGVACLGLSFKPDIDDLRESPAIRIVQNLELQGVNVFVVEPNIADDSRFSFISLNQAIKSADILVVLVKHKEFIEAAQKNAFSRDGVIDFCGIFD